MASRCDHRHLSSFLYKSPACEDVSISFESIILAGNIQHCFSFFSGGCFCIEEVLPRFRNMSRRSLPNDVLILLNVQTGFDHPTYWGFQRSNRFFETNIAKLLLAFREAARSPIAGSRPSIIHIYYSSPDPSSPLHSSSDGINFQPYATPTQREVVISKSVNSAFIDTNLEEMLRVLEAERLFIAGLTTDHCISTSIRMAANLEVTDRLDKDTGKLVKGQVILIEDATATWDKGGFDAETVHKVHVASLKGEFCEVTNTREVLKMICGTYAPL